MNVLFCSSCRERFTADGDRIPLVIPDGDTFCKACIASSANNASVMFSFHGDLSSLPINKALLGLLDSSLTSSPVSGPVLSSSGAISADDLLHALESNDLSVSQLQDVKNAVEKHLIVAAQRERETRRKVLILERSDCLQLLSSCDKEIAELQSAIAALQEKKVQTESRISEINGHLAELKKEIDLCPPTAVTSHRGSPEVHFATMDLIRNVAPVNSRYICPICGIACKSTTKLQNHAETEHNL